MSQCPSGEFHEVIFGQVAHERVEASGRAAGQAWAQGDHRGVLPGQARRGDHRDSHQLSGVYGDRRGRGLDMDVGFERWI